MAKIGLPSISSKLPADVRQFLDRIGEFFGDAASSFITRKELSDAGVITVDDYSRIWNGGKDEASRLIPPAPTGVAASGAMTNILVEWNAPGYSNHAYAEVWASGVDDLGQAVMIGTTPANLYAHAVGAGQTRYYWIRFVSKATIKGPYNGVAGVLGQTSQDPAWLLQVLTGELSESQLMTALRSRIQLIDGVDPNVPALPADLFGGILHAVKTIRADQSMTVRSLDSAYEQFSQALLKLKEHDDTFRTADIRIDPATGQIKIFALDQIREGLAKVRSDVSIGLDAVTAEITLKASKAYVDQAVTTAVINPTQLAALGDVYARLTQAEIDISGAEASIALKASSITLNGVTDRVTITESEIDVLQGQIALVATDASLGVLDARVTTAELNISAIDGASVSQMATDSRYFKREDDAAGEENIQFLLDNHVKWSGTTLALALAREELNGRVSEVDGKLVAESQARTTLESTVGANFSYLQNNYYTKTNTDSAISEATNELAATVDENFAYVITHYSTSADTTNAIARSSGEVSAVSTKNLDAQAEIQLGDIMNVVEKLRRQGVTIATVKEDTYARIKEGLEAEAGRRETLAAIVAGNLAAIDEERLVRTTEDTALASDIASLQVEVGENGADIIEEKTVRATQDSMLAYFITALQTRVGLNSAAITQESTVRSDANSAFASQQSSISAKMGTLSKTFYSTTPPTKRGVDTTVTPNVDIPLADGDLWIDTDDNNKLYCWSASAWVAARDGTIAAVDARVTTLDTAMIGYATRGGAEDLNLTSLSDVNAWNVAHPTDLAVWHRDRPFSTAVKQVTISFGGTPATIEDKMVAVATDTGNLRLEKTIRLDSGGAIVGYGIAGETDPTTGVTHSEFIVATDEFAVVAPMIVASSAPSTPAHGQYWKHSGTGVIKRWNANLNTPAWETVDYRLPFAILTTARDINGVHFEPGIYVDGASIVKASIGNSQIGFIAADKITVGMLTAIDMESALSYGSEFYIGGTATYTYDDSTPPKRMSISGVTGAHVQITADGFAANVGYFQIKNPGFDNEVPFQVVGDVVYLKTAFIQDGTITTAKIGDAQITSAKINDLSADKINAGTLSAARIAAGSLNADKLTANTIYSDLIIGKSCTAFESPSGTTPDSYWYSYSFTMDHAGWVVGLSQVNFVVSTGGGTYTYESRIAFDNTTYYNGYSGTFTNASGPTGISLQRAAYLLAGTHTVYVWAQHTGNTGANHLVYVTLLKSYR